MLYMKRIVSVSIGSSLRDHLVEIDILGEKYLIQRIGTDGDIKKAISMINELDGKVDAIGRRNRFILLELQTKICSKRGHSNN